MTSIIEKIIKETIKILIIILTAILLYSTLDLIIIVIKTFISKNEAYNYDSAKYNRENIFLASVQGLISAVLLITIIIELIYSLIEYLGKSNRNYIMIIIEIALIALIRHLLVLDIEHIHSDVLIGISSLLFVLGLFYLIIQKRIFIVKYKSSRKGD